MVAWDPSRSGRGCRCSCRRPVISGAVDMNYAGRRNSPAMRGKRLSVLLCWSLLACSDQALALGGAQYVATTRSSGAFPLAQGKEAAPLIVDPGDWPGVVRAARDLLADVNRVTGLTPGLVLLPKGRSHERNGVVVIIGTVGKSSLIDRLVKDRKIDVADIAGKWESFFLQTVADPMPGVAQALVIAGSDKRGTIYGIYDLSEQIGVSPWYWWADVPVKQQSSLHVIPGSYTKGQPAVEYRGIFINDEQ